MTLLCAKEESLGLLCYDYATWAASVCFMFCFEGEIPRRIPSLGLAAFAYFRRLIAR